MIADSIAIDELLLVLKIAFLVLLYLFIWQIVRSARRELRPSAQLQESIVLRPGDAQHLGLQRRGGRLVVVESPTLKNGAAYALDGGPLAIGRSEENDVELRGDEFASASHARIEARQDGVWIVDRGSTNGTYVNGIRLDEARRLDEGDLIRIGETKLRYEP